jgi:hypothetical protein
MNLTEWQVYEISQSLDYSKVDCEAVTLALMFDQDPRIMYCDDDFCDILDNMDTATVQAHICELGYL